MRTHTPTQTAALLPYAPLAEACANILRAKKAEAATAPERLHLSLPNGGVLLVMPASDRQLAITKLVTVHAENPALGLPTIQGEIVVMDAATGERLGILDGPALTARRTAAVSLLAAQLLAGEEAKRGPLLMIGAGAQARGHIEAFREGLGVSEVLICSRTRASAEHLAEHAEILGMRARILKRAEDEISGAGMVVTATTSVEPVLPEKVPAGLFIAAIGAYRPHMAEVPEPLMRSARVVADTAGALTEGGDIVRAGLGAAEVELLENLLDAPKTQERETRPVVFKGTGHALFDLAAAKLAMSIETDMASNRAGC